MFEGTDPLPTDPILGLSIAMKADPRPGKIDLGVGVYKDANGTTPIMAAVRSAERHVFEAQTTKAYTPMAGFPGFVDEIKTMLFGEEIAERTDGIQAPGGCGALRIGGELLASRGAKRIVVGSPT